MKRSYRPTHMMLGCCCCAAALLSLTGCKADAPKLTEKETQNFKGGPMPEDVRRQMEENNRKVQQQAASQAGRPPSADAVPTAPSTDSGQPK